MEKIFDDDIKVNVSRLDNKETLIDNEFATTYIINIDRFGQVSRSFYGLCNKDIIKAIEINSKDYIKKLKKEFKSNILLEEKDVEVKKEDIPDKNKLKKEITKNTNKDLKKKKEIYEKLETKK